MGGRASVGGMNLLKELCETPGISGREQLIINILKREFEASCDSVTVDAMGNVTGFKKGTGKAPKKIMIAGHMDEIGFIVSHIDKNGFIRFSPRGGHVPRVLISQRVRIFGNGGKNATIGIVECTPFFLEKEKGASVPEIKNFYIDTGLKASAVKKTIQIGDVIVLDREFLEQGDCYISKAFDNRVGCYVVAETMKRLKKHSCDVYAVGSSQEEVGVRGAKRAAQLVTPDIGIALDVTAAADLPGVAEHEQVTKLGEGVAIKINDMATISNHGIVEFMKKLAKKYKIKHQLEVLPFGGTDALGLQMFGSGMVCTLSLPTRYVHSPNEMIHKGDLKATIDLLVKFIENVDQCEAQF